MATIRIDIREDDGSSTMAEVRTARPEQVEMARELALDITNRLAPAEAADGA